MGYRSNVTYTMTKETFDTLVDELTSRNPIALIHRDVETGKLGFSDLFDKPEIDTHGNTVIIQWKDVKWYENYIDILIEFIETFNSIIYDSNCDYSYLRIGENYNDIDTRINTDRGELEAVVLPNVATVIDIMDRTAIHPGDYVCYTRRNTDHHELGVVKRRNNTDDGWFVWYSANNTASDTPDDCLTRITGNIDINHYANIDTDLCTPEMLGGNERRELFDR